jgi:flagellar basal body-associated protein FliL
MYLTAIHSEFSCLSFPFLFIIIMVTTRMISTSVIGLLAAMAASASAAGSTNPELIAYVVDWVSETTNTGFDHNIENQSF